jgi:hypothetical protein
MSIPVSKRTTARTRSHACCDSHEHTARAQLPIAAASRNLGFHSVYASMHSPALHLMCNHSPAATFCYHQPAV